MRWKLPALALSMIVAAGGTALADVPDASAFNTATVPAAAPFGALPVDTGISGATAFNALLASLTAAQTTELNERCAVVINTAWQYGESDVVFCARFYVAQGILPYEEVDEPSAGNDAGSAYHDAAGNVVNDAYYDL